MRRKRYLSLSTVSRAETLLSKGCNVAREAQKAEGFSLQVVLLIQLMHTAACMLARTYRFLLLLQSFERHSLLNQDMEIRTTLTTVFFQEPFAAADLFFFHPDPTFFKKGIFLL